MRAIVQVKSNRREAQVIVCTELEGREGTEVSMNTAQTREFIDGLERALRNLNPDAARQAKQAAAN